MSSGRLESESGIFNHYRELKRLIATYDSALIRAYSTVRFKIININILDMLALCLRDRRIVLDIGCGFGLFGCYFARRYPHIHYVGCDINEARIELANRTARALDLRNITFVCQDARNLNRGEKSDAILMIDLLHHLNDPDKLTVLEGCRGHLLRGGRLVIKEVTTRPFHKIAFTWLLDVLMTRGFDMWYWDQKEFRKALGSDEWEMETFPISDWVPYPHVIYLFDRKWNVDETFPLVEQTCCDRMGGLRSE